MLQADMKPFIAGDELHSCKLQYVANGTLVGLSVPKQDPLRYHVTWAQRDRSCQALEAVNSALFCELGFLQLACLLIGILPSSFVYIDTNFLWLPQASCSCVSACGWVGGIPLIRNNNNNNNNSNS